MNQDDGSDPGCRANNEFGIVSHSALPIISMAQYPDDDPIYFQATSARAAAWRTRCKKIALLFEHLQIDLEFTSVDDAQAFVRLIENIAMSAGNPLFNSHELQQNVPFMRADFDMIKLGYVDRTPQSWMKTPDENSDWPRLRQTGEWSDFTIIAGGKTFAVHRIRLCKESLYFRAVCSGGFAESAKQSIELPESAQTVGALLDEIYGTYNSTTGSLFTSFALRPEMEKERAMASLLDLFIAADKYNLEKVKRKISEAIIDRLPFVKDALTIVDMATNTYHEQFPYMDGGLRKVVIAQIDARLPAILEDEAAWNELSGTKMVLKALHEYQCELRDDETSGIPITPPVTPVSSEKKRRAQDM
ncbi:hypothetical protein BKA63DRAFT_550432 [Paraphoma chrysanthemicola]|nr:hypothetical protein BKA63DRAFT_550432 [Paraphoma chrysanthemicola]